MGFGSGGGRRSVFVCPLLTGPLEGGGIEGTFDGRGKRDGAFGNRDGTLGGAGMRDLPDGAGGAGMRDLPDGAGGRTVERPPILAVLPFSSSFFDATRGQNTRL